MKPKKKLVRRYPLEVIDEEDGIFRLRTGNEGIWIASMLRKPLYNYGVRNRLNKLAETYNAKRFNFSGKVVLDVGANIGEFAKYVHRRGAKVIAIEPDPKCFRALVKNTKGRWTNLDCALWDEDTDIEFYVDTDYANSSLIAPQNVKETTRVRAITLVTLFDELSIDEVFFLKADLEGGEPEMLEGAGDQIRRIEHLAIDVGPERQGKTTIDACMKFLEKHRYDTRLLPQKRQVLFARRLP